MKRITALILLLTLALCLCACNTAGGTSDVTSNTTGLPQMLQEPKEFTSLEAFEASEKKSGQKALTYYYTPGNLTRDYEFSKITKRDGVYVMLEYKVSKSKVISAEKLGDYDAERLGTLIFHYYLYENGNTTLKSFTDNGYKAIEYEGKVYYRWDEHAENNPDKKTIGYEVAFIEDGKMIHIHLPAVDTFENMMKFADVVKVNID